jgi:hypothetical protein
VNPRAAALLGRILAAGQLAGGGALLARPDRCAARAAGREAARPPTPIVRILGVRLASQGAAALLRPTRTIVLGGAAVDAIHAASMVGLAAVDGRYRRVALLSAAAAVAAGAAASISATGRGRAGR